MPEISAHNNTILPFSDFQPDPDLVRAANNFTALMWHVCNDLERLAGRDGLNYFLQRQARTIDMIKAAQDS